MIFAKARWYRRALHCRKRHRYCDKTRFGSDIELVRSTIRLGYYLPFAPKALAPGVVEDKRGTPLQRWFQQSSLAFGARAGIVHSLNHSGPDEPTTLPIDERFFNGGGTTVRSFGERDLGPRDRHGNPIGGEFLPCSMLNTRFRSWASCRERFLVMPAIYCRPRSSRDSMICVMRLASLTIQAADRADSSRLWVQPGPAPERRLWRVSFQFRICVLVLTHHVIACIPNHAAKIRLCSLTELTS